MPLPTEILDQIDEQYRDHASLTDFDDVSALAKSYVETKAMVGNSVRRPGKDAGPEAHQEYLDKLINNDPDLMLKPDFSNKDQSHEFFRTIGLPSESAEYENPEDMNLDEAVEAEMRSLLYEAKIPQSGYAQIMKAFSDRQSQTTTMNAEMFESSMKDLKGKWGLATDDRMTAARKAKEDFPNIYPGRDFESLTGKEVQSLYEISTALTGKGALAAHDDGGIPSDAMTPQEAINQANEMMARARKNLNGDLTREEIAALMKKGMALKTKYAGYEGSLDSLRA
jgi:hypothetical protein